MSLVCEHCGGVQWHSAPALREAWEHCQRLGRFTASDISDAMSTSPQSAANRVKRLHELGLIRWVRRRPVSGGGAVNIYELRP